MSKVDYETKMNSKPYRFFDLIYRLLVVNVLTIILSCTVIFLFPSFVAATATLKEGNVEMNIFKQYFINFKKYLKKSFFTGLIMLIFYLVLGYAIYFYAKAYFTDDEEHTLGMLFLNAGFMVCLVGFLIVLFLNGHMALIIISFTTLTIPEIFRTGFYVTFRYLLTTLILFVLNLLIIVGLICCIIRFQVLAIWMLLGISLPIYLGVKITAPVYYKFSKIDFEKIMHAGEEESDE